MSARKGRVEPTRAKVIAVDPEVRRQICALIQRVGHNSTLLRLGLSPITLNEARSPGGFLQPKTIARIVEALKREERAA